MTEHIPVAIRENIEKAFGDNNLRTDVHLQALIGKDAGGWVAMDDLFVLLPRMKRLVKKRLSALLAAGPPTPGAPKPTLNSVLAGALTSSSVVDIDPSSPVGNGIRRSANLPTSAPTLPMPDAPLKHLVLDSGAIIHGVSTDFHSKAEQFWTIPEVIEEIRDRKSREALEKLPFELRLKEPSEDAMGFVCRFAKLTGDFGFLSLTDLKVLALAYMLERQESGDNHLRSKPKVMRAMPVAKQVTSGSVVKGALRNGDPTASTAEASIGGGESGENEAGTEPREEGADDDGRDNEEEKDDDDDDDDDDEEDNEEDNEEDEEEEDNEEDDEVNEDNDDDVSDQQREGAGDVTPEENGTVDNGSESGDSFEDLGSDDDWDPDGPGPGEAETNGDVDEEELFALEQEMRSRKAVSIAEGAAEAVANFELKNEEFPSLGNKDESAVVEDTDTSGAADTEKPTGWRAIVATSTAVDAPAPLSWGKVARSDSVEPPKSSPPGDAVKPDGSGGGVAGSGGQVSRKGVVWERKTPASESTVVYGKGTGKEESDDGGALLASEITSAAVAVPPRASYSSRILGAASSGMSSKRDDGDGDDDNDGGGWTNPSNIAEARALGVSMTGARRIDFFQCAPTAEGAPSGEAASSPSTGNAEAVAASSSAPSKKKSSGNRKSGKTEVLGTGLVARSACVTTDFAMQAVLIQIGLRLLSVEGYQVRRVTQFVLRCNACFLVTTDTEKLFCGRCGGAHLSRIAASVDPKTGEQKLFLKKDYKHRLQGTKYPLPKPGTQRKGRFGGQVVLREDQMQMGIWAQKIAPKAKEKTSMFGAEVNEKTGVKVAKSAHTVEVGLGRRNPNSTKGRERRGKKKKKT
jgi:rRNA maturation endonuclease Nob1